MSPLRCRSRLLSAVTALGLASLVAGCLAVGDEPIISASAGVNARPLGPAITQPRTNPEHARLIASYGGVYSNERVERAVARVVGKLVAASDEPSRSYNLTILNSPAVNAFALPSGDLYITRGLLALANDEAELAAVIAHEMAHVTANHAAARQRRAQAVAVANRVMSNVVSQTDVAQSARETTELSLARFSQAQELEADAIGVKTLANAGFDPYAAGRFLKAMGSFAALPSINPLSETRPDFLSSHPATPSRIDVAVREARQYAAPGVGATHRERYLADLDGILWGDDPREGFVRGREFLHADLGIGFTVPEGFVLKNTAEAVLATDGARTAIRFDAVPVPRDVTLTDYLASGWVNGLDPASVTPARIGGLEAATAAASVDGWAFRIGVVRVRDQVYRFIFATSGRAATLEAPFDGTFESFRVLTPGERAGLRPLRIRVIETGPGETIRQVAQKMRGIDPSERERLFLALNGLAANGQLVPGQEVKIVAD